MTIIGILDLVIGLFFIYFVFSVICSSIVEVIAQFMQWRSKELELWIKDNFKTQEPVTGQGEVTGEHASSDKSLGESLLQHYLIRGLSHRKKGADYIPANIFSSTFFDLVYNGFRKQESNSAPSETYNNESLRLAIQGNKLLSEELKRYLLQAINDTPDSLLPVKQRLEDWFNAGMDRLSGNYKNKIRTWTLLISFAVAIAANVDTIALSKYLKENSETTGRAIVEVARQATQDSLLYKEAQQTSARITSVATNSDSAQAIIDSTLIKIKRSKERSMALVQSLSETGLPLGWEQDGPRLKSILLKDSEKDSKADEDGSKKESTDSRDTTAQTLVPSNHPTPNQPTGYGWLLMKLLGITLSALALTVGAPFWFDIIKKLVDLRGSGNKPAGETK